MEYKIKWLDFVDEDWVPAKWCDCQEKIDNYEKENTESYEVDRVVDKRIKNGEVSKNLFL